MGLLDIFRRGPSDDDPTPSTAATSPAARSLTASEVAAIRSLQERVGDTTELTGALELDDDGRVRFETIDGGMVPPGNGLKEEEAALVRGRHYTRWADTIRQLKRDGQVEKALALALECVDATEREGRVSGLSPAPGYTKMAAIIYRQRGDLDAEIALIERYLAARESATSENPGVLVPKLAERLEKARVLRAKRNP